MCGITGAKPLPTANSRPNGVAHPSPITRSPHRSHTHSDQQLLTALLHCVSDKADSSSVITPLRWAGCGIRTDTPRTPPSTHTHTHKAGSGRVRAAEPPHKGAAWPNRQRLSEYQLVYPALRDRGCGSSSSHSAPQPSRRQVLSRSKGSGQLCVVTRGASGPLCGLRSIGFINSSTDCDAHRRCRHRNGAIGTRGRRCAAAGSNGTRSSEDRVVKFSETFALLWLQRSTGARVMLCPQRYRDSPNPASRAVRGKGRLL